MLLVPCLSKLQCSLNWTNREYRKDLCPRWTCRTYLCWPTHPWFRMTKYWKLNWRNNCRGPIRTNRETFTEARLLEKFTLCGHQAYWIWRTTCNVYGEFDGDTGPGKTTSVRFALLHWKTLSVNNYWKDKTSLKFVSLWVQNDWVVRWSLSATCCKHIRSSVISSLVWYHLWWTIDENFSVSIKILMPFVNLRDIYLPSQTLEQMQPTRPDWLIISTSAWTFSWWTRMLPAQWVWKASMCCGCERYGRRGV